MLRPYVTDGTIMDIELIDDPASKEWCFDLKTVFAMTDKIACAVKDSAPNAALGARALPTQMAAYSPYNCLTTARAQYAGPGKHFHPDTFVVQQVRSAERQKLGIIWGMNLWAMGCGPVPTPTKPRRAGCLSLSLYSRPPWIGHLGTQLLRAERR